MSEIQRFHSFEATLSNLTRFCVSHKPQTNAYACTWCDKASRLSIFSSQLGKWSCPLLGSPFGGWHEGRATQAVNKQYHCKWNSPRIERVNAHASPIKWLPNTHLWPTKEKRPTHLASPMKLCLVRVYWTGNSWIYRLCHRTTSLKLHCKPTYTC